MKYATNHPWKFDDNGGMFLAWLAGFLQASMILVVESVNYVALITNTTHIDIVMNFLALAVIADFDDFFYGALFDNEYKQVITDTDVYGNFLETQTTTSFFARFQIKGNRVKRQEVEKIYASQFPEPDRDDPTSNINERLPKHIFIDFWKDRNWYNKICFIIYKIFRVVIVSVWYYFIPFVAMVASFIVPAILRGKGNGETDAGTTAVE